MRCNSKAKHSVTMEARFWISKTFLERDGRPFALSNDERKVWATVLLLNAIMHWKVIHVNFFCFFCHISTTTVFFCFHGNVTKRLLLFMF